MPLTKKYIKSQQLFKVTKDIRIEISIIRIIKYDFYHSSAIRYNFMYFKVLY